MLPVQPPTPDVTAEWGEIIKWLLIVASGFVGFILRGSLPDAIKQFLTNASTEAEHDRDIERLKADADVQNRAYLQMASHWRDEQEAEIQRAQFDTLNTIIDRLLDIISEGLSPVDVELAHQLISEMRETQRIIKIALEVAKEQVVREEQDEVYE